MRAIPAALLAFLLLTPAVRAQELRETDVAGSGEVAGGGSEGAEVGAAPGDEAAVEPGDVPAETEPAETEPEPEPAETEPAADGTAAAAEGSAPVVRGPRDRRPVPDYDGLPDPGPTPEEVLIWFPRILLMPLYLVTEFVIRRPLGELLTVAEREGWIDSIVNFFTWDDRRAGLVPVAFFDFGFLPSVGLYFFWNDAGAPGHQVRAQVGFGGVDWQRATISDRTLLAPNLELTLRVDAWRWPDRIYQGTGAHASSDNRARFRQAVLDGSATLSATFWRRSSFVYGLGVRWNDFSADGWDPSGIDPSIEQAVAEGSLNAAPAGIDGYVAYHQWLHLAIDSREDSPAPQHGFRLDLLAEQGVDLRRPYSRQWLRYGGTLSGFVDAGNERVFSLHAHVEFVDPLDEDDVPFLELVSFGGQTLRLPAHLPGTLLGRSGVALTARYRWPVWVHLDASLYLGAGNVFEEHLSDFSFDALRLAWGLEIQTLGDRDHAFRIGFGFGTRPLDEGFEVESFRLLIGNALGF